MNYTALDAFGSSYGNLKKIKVFQNDFNEDIEKGSQNIVFGSAITWLKIMQTLQVGGVLESTRSRLEDGHRYI